jgi:hypothetical protein
MGALRQLRITKAMPPPHELSLTPFLQPSCLHSTGLFRGWSSDVTTTVRDAALSVRCAPLASAGCPGTEYADSDKAVCPGHLPGLYLVAPPLVPLPSDGPLPR